MAYKFDCLVTGTFDNTDLYMLILLKNNN